MRDLPTALWPIYGITFIDILGYTILIPLLPFFVNRFGASAPLVGLLLTVTAVCAAVSSPLWGALSDRTGRKTVLVASQACSLAGYLVLALAGTFPLVVVSRAIEGLGGGNLGVAQSYIADVTTEEQRPQAFAFGAAAFGAGFVLGPLIGGLLVGLGFTVPFLAAAGLQACNIALTLRFVPHRTARASASDPKRNVFAILRRPVVVNLLLRQSLYIFAYTYFFTIFSLFLGRTIHAGPSTSSFLLGSAGVIGAATMILGVGPLTRRFGERAVAAGAFALACAAYAVLGFVHDVKVFVGFLILWAASGAALRPTLNALLSDAAPEDERGAVLGFADGLSNGAMVFAPALGAYLVAVGPALTGVVPGLACALAFVLGLRPFDPAARARPA